VAQPPKFDESISWVVLQWQFETMEEHHWMTHEKAMYPHAALNDLAVHILDGISTGVMNEHVTEVLENYYCDHHLEAVFHSQPKDPACQGIPAGVCCPHQPLGTLYPCSINQNRIWE
jgi:hypothetical protein